jgi:intracellular sulfur oxidation DsrE/DsrF family protein
MRVLFFIFLLLSGLFADDAKKVVFDLKTGDIKTFERAVFKSVEAHTTYYTGLQQEYRVVFVIHGDAYKFFLKALKGTPYAGDAVAARRAEFGRRLKALTEHYDVTFEVCSFGMKARGLPFEQLYPFVTPIFSATSGLIEWQEKGYAYIMVP